MLSPWDHLGQLELFGHLLARAGDQLDWEPFGHILVRAEDQMGELFGLLLKRCGPLGLGTIWVSLSESQGPDGWTIWIFPKRA